MSCDTVRAALVGYHFGVTGEDRATIEAHLPTCAACVRELIELKRAIELGDDDLPAPSAAARDRLRAAVAAELRPKPRRRWERPLAFAVAAAATVAAIFATQAVTMGPGAPPLSGEQLDP